MKTTAKTIRQVDRTWLNKEIARRLRRVREQRGYTPAQVGVALGVTPAAVRNWERGTQANMVVTTIYNLALFYGVSVKSLLPP